MPTSDWNDSLQTDPDNYLIVTQSDLLFENPNPLYAEIPPEWFDDIIKTLPWGRTGSYGVTGVLGGQDPISADACVWGHVAFGDNGNQLWNGSGDDADDTSDPVCRTMFPGMADPSLAGAAVGWSLTYSPQEGLVAPFMEGEEHLRAQATWLLAVRSHLGKFGALYVPSGLNPEDDGAPPEAVLQWENDLELVKVEMAGDSPARQTSASCSFYVNDALIPPQPEGGEDPVPWPKGGFGAADDTGRTYREFLYDAVGEDWVELDEITSWDDLQPLDGDLPDHTIGLQKNGAGEIDGSGDSSAHVAIKYTFRSPRYRWVWGDLAVVRQYPRDDGRGLSSAPRLYPPTKARRLVGGYM